MSNHSSRNGNSFSAKVPLALSESAVAVSQTLSRRASEKEAVEFLSRPHRFSTRVRSTTVQETDDTTTDARALRVSSWLTTALLLVVYTYCDSSVAILMQVYKEQRLHDGIGSPGCAPLQMCLDGVLAGICTVDSEASVAMEERRLAGPGEGDSEPAVSGNGQLRDITEIRREERDCPWYIVRSIKPGKQWHKRPHTFTKGVALSIQACIGLALYYGFNLWQGGFSQLKLCWAPKRLIRFGLVGCLFGLGAVFSFLAQDALEPSSYALYAQANIVVVPILWRICFRKSLAQVSWIHIVLIGFGIAIYRISAFNEQSAAASLSGTGLFWVSMKVICTSCASIVAEMFLKGDDPVPFSVQASCILPWKIISTFSTVFLLPPHGLPDRPGGPLHDWTFWTVVIIFHNLGDTIFSAVIAKTFDSVVKAICGVVGIICPTMIVSMAAGWEKFDVETPGGQLKSTGSVIVLLSSFAYVLGRSLNAAKDRSDEKLEAAESALAELRAAQSPIARVSSDSNAGGRSSSWSPVQVASGPS